MEITECPGESCKDKNTWIRCTSTTREYWQTWSHFHLHRTADFCSFLLESKEPEVTKKKRKKEHGTDPKLETNAGRINASIQQ